MKHDRIQHHKYLYNFGSHFKYCFIIYIFPSFSYKWTCFGLVISGGYGDTRSVIDTKESDGIEDPMEKIAIKSHSDLSDSGIGKMLILIDAYFVILLQCNKMTK